MNTVEERFDVIVAGGGSAGVAAAVGSARSGARTLLIERYYCLGGASTMRNVLTYCGLYTLDEHPRMVVGGVGAEVVGRLKRRDALTGPFRFRGVFVVFDPEVVKVVLDEICQAAGVTVMHGTMVVAAEREAGMITTVTVATMPACTGSAPRRSSTAPAKGIWRPARAPAPATAITTGSISEASAPVSAAYPPTSR